MFDLEFEIRNVRCSMFDLLTASDFVGYASGKRQRLGSLSGWEAPAARNVYSSDEKKLASSVRSDI
jgi:hypothetical protein